VFALCVGLALLVPLLAPAPAAAQSPQVRVFTADLDPDTDTAGNTSDYSIEITNSSTSTRNLGSVQITIPTGYAVNSVGTPSGDQTWTASLTAFPGFITLQAAVPEGTNVLEPGQSISVTFNVTAPCTADTYEWTSEGDQDAPWDGTPNFDEPTAQPEVVVTGTCGSAPAPPVFTGTDPASPSNDSTPSIEGTAEAGSTVKLYDDDACTDPPVAMGTATGGVFSIPVTLVGDGTYTFYATATNSFGTSDCTAPDHIQYVLDTAAPDAPTVSGPASPGMSTSITVEVDSGDLDDLLKVTLYRTDDCTGTPEGTPNQSTVDGIAAFNVTVDANTTTSFTAISTDEAGNPSACSNVYSYTHDSIDPATPAITASDPASPANDTSPKLIGTTDAGTTMSIHLQSDCSDDQGWTGSDAVFTTTGIQVAAAAGTTTTFYAKATDLAGNESSCSPGFNYVELNPSSAVQFDTATLYLGWKNSDDINTAVDLKVEFLSGSTSLGSGETYCYRGLLRDLSKIKAVEVPLNGGINVPTGEDVTVRLFVRIGTNGAGARCTGTGASHANARGIRFYYDADTRGSMLSNSSAVFFTSDGTTCASVLSSGVTTRTFDTAPAGDLHCQDSPAIKFTGGNLWQQIGGDWTLNVP
jgi:hypothetical protein